jgi:hypothetical protein
MTAMAIPVLAGRNFVSTDADPRVAIVNQAFAAKFLHQPHAISATFATVRDGSKVSRIRIVGVVRNARYGGLRGPMPPVAYFPFRSVDTNGAPEGRRQGTFIVRSFHLNALSLSSSVRREIAQASTELKITNLRTQKEIVAEHTTQERLLAILATFFSGLVLLLAGIGMYSLVNYSISQRTREIGIRMAIGARPADIWRLVSIELLSILGLGSLTGLILGAIAGRCVQGLLYQVKITDPNVLAISSLTVLVLAAVAATPVLIRAIRIDPAMTLRAD